MSHVEAPLFPPHVHHRACRSLRALREELAQFAEFGRRTVCTSIKIEGHGEVPVFINEFWTSKQRAASSLHEISYRACFKPQLPRFFVERLTEPGDVVYDPFMGRGTSLLEAALLGRIPYGCDVNPLSAILIRPRLNPPRAPEVKARLSQICFSEAEELPEELLTFYHPKTLKEICALRSYLLRKRARGALDDVDLWIWMVATNRLTGHSPGFFSVYTMPPNQAISIESQRKINLARGQIPPRRNVPELILRKSDQLLKDVNDPIREKLREVSKRSLILTASSDHTPDIPSETVSLVVTSPPFLDTVDYAKDNWLRAWFCGIDISRVQIWQLGDLREWETCMGGVFRELRRLLLPDGWVAFEVGEIRSGKIRLEEPTMKIGMEEGLSPVLLLINEQRFTKTAHCWGIENLKKGTNTNRVVLFQKSR